MIRRVKPINWGRSHELTSKEMNALDRNVQRMTDKIDGDSVHGNWDGYDAIWTCHSAHEIAISSGAAFNVNNSDGYVSIDHPAIFDVDCIDSFLQTGESVPWIAETINTAFVNFGNVPSLTNTTYTRGELLDVQYGIAYNNDDGYVHIGEAYPGNQGHVQFPIEPPHRSILTSIQLGLKGAAGHGSLNANPPQIKLLRVSQENGEVQVISPISVDTSGNVSAYETAHSINLNTFNIAEIDRQGYLYLLDVRGESVVNNSSYVPAMPIFSLRWQIKLTRIDPPRI